MNKIMLLMLCLCIMASSAGKNPAISIATYNIAAIGQGGDIKNTAAAIKSIDADIIALQEVDINTERSGKINQIDSIARLTAYYYAFGKAIDYQGGEYGIATLSKYPIIESKIIALPSTNTATGVAEEPRVMLITRIAVPEFADCIIFINTHLDWHDDPNIRQQQVQKINEEAGKMYGIRILAGDLNDTLHSAPINELAQRWTSVFNEGIKYHTYPSEQPTIGIDHIFLYNEHKWRVKNIYIPINNNGEGINWHHISDHLPACADLELILP